MGSFLIAFTYLRPIILALNSMPLILLKWSKQVKVLKHERNLQINDHLFLYKDHQRRLLQVIITMVKEFI